MRESEIKYNILVVEDNNTVSELICKALSKNKKYCVKVTDKIKWARKALTKKYFDLICLDIMLPDGNGIELCKELKKEHCYKNTKIIIISKKTQACEKVSAFEIGADEYLAKPFHPHELNIRIKKQLGLIRASKKDIEFKKFKLDPIHKKFLYEGYQLPLTETEFLLLKYLFEHNGIGQIDTLAQFISSKKLKDVERHSIIVSIKRLKDKLERNTGNPFIKTKYGHGYYIP